MLYPGNHINSGPLVFYPTVCSITALTVISLLDSHNLQTTLCQLLPQEGCCCNWSGGVEILSRSTLDVTALLLWRRRFSSLRMRTPARAGSEVHGVLCLVLTLFPAPLYPALPVDVFFVYRETSPGAASGYPSTGRWRWE